MKKPSHNNFFMLFGTRNAFIQVPDFDSVKRHILWEQLFIPFQLIFIVLFNQTDGTSTNWIRREHCHSCQNSENKQQ